jgi:hypothetical protein
VRVEWVVDDLSYLFFWDRGENNPLNTIYLSLLQNDCKRGCKKSIDQFNLSIFYLHILFQRR